MTDEVMKDWTVHRIDEEGRLWLSPPGSAVDILLIFSERAIDHRRIAISGTFLSILQVLPQESFLPQATSCKTHAVRTQPFCTLAPAARLLARTSQQKELVALLKLCTFASTKCWSWVNVLSM